ncbi:MAG: alpha/beta hydrolase family protein [Oscillochloridaceae bacterium umkhey_bin13]
MLTVHDYLAWPAVVADQRVAYGPHPAQFGDLYLPAGSGPHPIIILIHGGCWQARFDLAPLGPLCAALRTAGWAVWSLEYRRLGDGGGWPNTFADVAAGADALRGLVAPLDRNRVIAAGHSAGGHLALWLAARARLPHTAPGWQPDPLPITGVLALAALADLALAAQQQLCDGAVAALLGGMPEAQPERYALASPAAQLPLGVPQYHIVGADDPIVPPAYLQSYCAKATAHGDAVTLTVLPAAGHFEPVDPTSAAWPELLAALDRIGAR